METEDENAVQPTRSLFGGAANPFASDAQPSELGVDAELDIVEQRLEDGQLDDQPEQVEPPVPQAVADVPKPVTEEIEEALPVVEESNEIQADEAEVAEPVVEEKPVTEIERLKAAREELDAQIADKQNAERKSVISQIAAVIKLYDIPLVDLMKALGGVPNPRKGEKAPILYRDDQGNTWTGRGKTPRWLKNKNPEDYRV